MKASRTAALAGIIVFAWLTMLLLFVAIERLIVPLPPLPAHLGGGLATSVLKPLTSLALAIAWLYAWRRLVKLYRKRALRSSRSPPR
ncbi:MAG: hypothetical protein N3H31_07030 [Candidatus Nezhaarchaeota archaeon]|nr:hypothetical protein [Candidatus Nezhaarchaeota archaeon]